MSGWTCAPTGRSTEVRAQEGWPRAQGTVCPCAQGWAANPRAPSWVLTRLPGAPSGSRETDLHCTRGNGSREASPLSWPVQDHLDVV